MLQQNYHEKDTANITKDGVLNRETGYLPIANFEVATQYSNKSELNSWSPFTILKIGYAKGDTNYDGYLQSGSKLTIYKTETKNQILLNSLDIGMSKKLTSNFGISPYVQVANYNWKRELKQYTENFQHTSLSFGMNIHWHGVKDAPINLTAKANYGKLLNSQIDVAGLGFKQSIGNGDIWSLGVQGNYGLSERINFLLAMGYQSWQYQHSKKQNGYQYPDSETEQTNYKLGLQYKFR